MIWRLRGRRRGSVTLVKSNVKALLTARGHQKMLLRSSGPRPPLSASQTFPPLSGESPLGGYGALPRQPAGCFPVLNALYKGQPHGLPKLQSVTNRDGGDDVLDLATAHQKTVTVVTL